MRPLLAASLSTVTFRASAGGAGGGGADEGAGIVAGEAEGHSDWEDVEDTTGWLILSDPL